MDSLIPFTTSGSLVDCVDINPSSFPSCPVRFAARALLAVVTTTPLCPTATGSGKMLVILRDGRKLHGVLRSYDQFANLVLEDTVERIYHGNVFAESWHGLFLIRGENVVLLGEIDLDQEEDVPLNQVDYGSLETYHKQELESKKEREEVKAQILYEQKGFCKEGGEGDGY